MAKFPTNPTAPSTAPTSKTYTELRIHTLLLCRIVTLLSQLVGPVEGFTVANQNSLVSWVPEDLTGDVDAWRNDPDFLGP